ncbi:uncharacterized protein LOC130820823 isoform X2 [Amaranthus tricolor]|uniref:uncharacterized protein LOC130820823 isoform X2 n=1 Tax=Amaranthus tricolor TaxID=29722 RepID=UPI002586D103|nr:uncharacterized protein LOC130820823 isoform X2 [Amaranthus tricolor]
MEEEGTLGGKMELLKLSRLKLHLRVLISEVKDLRERERSSGERLRLSILKQLEEEFGRKLKELESELASSNEAREKLERTVSYLQNDNALLEIKQKDLNATVQNLLQSREQFVNAYQESTNDMKRSIEARDRKLKYFSEKLKSHLLLFDSIEKEALCVKQFVDNVRHVINDKEEIVIGLKRKFDELPEVEKVFMEKIKEMGNKLGNYKDELQRKDKVIYELEAKLEAERNSNKSQAQLEILQRSLSKKDAVIQNLISEKQALDSELKSLAIALRKIQHAFRDMNEDKKAFLSIAESAEKCKNPGEEMRRIEDSKVDTRKESESLLTLGGFGEFQETNETGFHAEEPASSRTQSVCSVPESATTAQTKPINEAKHAQRNQSAQQLKQKLQNVLARFQLIIPYRKRNMQPTIKFAQGF